MDRVRSCSSLFGFIIIAAIILSIDCHPISKRAVFYIANETVCMVDGVVYYNGEPVPSDNPCEFCKCRPPGFACVYRSCEAKPGCKAVRREKACCPDYICGCTLKGRYYEDGSEVEDPDNPCYICRCQEGTIACAHIDCSFRADCVPKYAEGQCCPKYSHCINNVTDDGVRIYSKEDLPSLNPIDFRDESVALKPLIPDETAIIEEKTNIVTTTVFPATKEQTTSDITTRMLIKTEDETEMAFKMDVTLASDHIPSVVTSDAPQESDGTVSNEPNPYTTTADKLYANEISSSSEPNPYTSAPEIISNSVVTSEPNPYTTVSELSPTSSTDVPLYVENGSVLKHDSVEETGMVVDSKQIVQDDELDSTLLQSNPEKVTYQKLPIDTTTTQFTTEKTIPKSEISSELPKVYYDDQIGDTTVKPGSNQILEEAVQSSTASEVPIEISDASITSYSSSLAPETSSDSSTTKESLSPFLYDSHHFPTEEEIMSSETDQPAADQSSSEQVPIVNSFEDAILNDQAPVDVDKVYSDKDPIIVDQVLETTETLPYTETLLSDETKTSVGLSYSQEKVSEIVVTEDPNSAYSRSNPTTKIANRIIKTIQIETDGMHLGMVKDKKIEEFDLSKGNDAVQEVMLKDDPATIDFSSSVKVDTKNDRNEKSWTDKQDASSSSLAEKIVPISTVTTEKALPAEIASTASAREEKLVPLEALVTSTEAKVPPTEDSETSKIKEKSEREEKSVPVETLSTSTEGKTIPSKESEPSTKTIVPIEEKADVLNLTSIEAVEATAFRKEPTTEQIKKFKSHEDVPTKTLETTVAAESSVILSSTTTLGSVLADTQQSTKATSHEEPLVTSDLPAPSSSVHTAETTVVDAEIKTPLPEIISTIVPRQSTSQSLLPSSSTSQTTL